MKNILFCLLLILMSCSHFSAYAQYNDEPEALDLPGDNLNLYAVLDVFQKSKTLEEFESAINDQESKINNLDLNNDNQIDYIQVVSEKKDNTHFIVLQVAINQSQKQDVAVIEVQKNKKGEIIVQIIGDEELYGKKYIIEPKDLAQRMDTPNPGYSGATTTIINNNTTNNYNSDSGSTVSAWPVVLHLFSPLFISWHSPWRWGYYPSYWRPWRPVYYQSYWGYHRHYHNHFYFHRTGVLRAPYYNRYYANRRVYSPIVRNNRVNGLYRSTYNGRVYRKPISPIVRPNGSNRPGANRPTTLPSNRYPNRPIVPNNGANRPTTLPSHRPVNNNNGSNRPTTLPSHRPVNPNNGSNRPVTLPSNRVPSDNRPVSPVSRPNTPVSRPSVPVTRPATNPVTRPAHHPVSRPAGNPVSRPETRPQAQPSSRPASSNRSSGRGSN